MVRGDWLLRATLASQRDGWSGYLDLRPVRALLGSAHSDRAVMRRQHRCAGCTCKRGRKAASRSQAAKLELAAPRNLGGPSEIGETTEGNEDRLAGWQLRDQSEVIWRAADKFLVLRLSSAPGVRRRLLPEPHSHFKGRSPLTALQA